MTVGVSMIATPAGFTATSITRPIALDVGRVVFAALNRAEFVALVILLAMELAKIGLLVFLGIRSLTTER